ncbi:hypothetical protein VDG1235_1290 [Verrucomicrobiia bacterium DG1235]|nr:hypothetical protein VDG1235_1290 [Verrucomicrobiae bacterium DG1235]
MSAAAKGSSSDFFTNKKSLGVDPFGIRGILLQTAKEWLKFKLNRAI